MVQLRLQGRSRDAVLVATTAAAVAVLSALILTGFVNLPLGGGGGGLLVGIALAVMPLVFLVTWRWPLLPFCLYAAILPLDGLNLGVTRNLPHLVGALASGILLLRLLAARSALRPPRAIFAWLALLLWMVMSFVWTENFPVGAQMCTQIAANLLLGYLLAITPFSRSEFQAVITSIVVGGVGSALYAIYLYQSGSTFQHQTDAGARVYFGTGAEYDLDPNFFAAALVLPIMIAVIAALRSRKLSLKLLLTAAAIVITFGIVVSGSRGAFIALVAGVLYLFLRGRYLAQLSVVAGIGGLGTFALPILWTRFSDPGAGEASGRVEFWKAGWYAFKQHWLFGDGVGSYRPAYEQAYLHVFQPGNFHTWSQDPHNLLFQTGVELGSIGLALLAIAWLVQFRTLRMIKPANPFYDMRCAIEAATVALFVSALSLDIMTMKWPWLCFSLAFVTRSAWMCVNAQAAVDRDKAAVEGAARPVPA